MSATLNGHRVPAVLASSVLAGLLSCLTGTQAPAADNAEPAPAARPWRGSLTEGLAGYKYLCYVPLVRTNAAQRLPLLLFLHGACPDDDLTKLRHFGPLKHALASTNFPFVVVPVTYGERMAQALAAAGGKAKATFYPDKGHDVWDAPYAGPELYAWFLQQRRTTGS